MTATGIAKVEIKACYFLMVSQGTKHPYVWGKELPTLSKAIALAKEQAKYLNANKGELDPVVIVTVLRKVEEYGLR